MARVSVKDWLTEESLIKIEGWSRDGLTNEDISHNIGCNPDTLYRWIKKYPDIYEALKAGKEVADRKVENAMYKSALGYEYEEVKTYIEEVDGVKKRRKEVTTKYLPPNTTAQIFWLKNRKPSEWRDKQNIEHSGNIDVGKKSDIILKYLDGDPDDSE